MSFFRRVKGLFPLTWAGVLFICLAYVVWYGEVLRHSNQILYASVALLIVIASIVFLFELIGAVLVIVKTVRRNRREFMHDTLETGQRLETGYRVFRPYFLPFVDTEVHLVEGPFASSWENDGAWSVERAVVEERGRYERMIHRITVGDIFGLTSITFEHETPFVAEIRPATCLFESFQFSARTSGEGYSYPNGDQKGELVEMRRYQAGDPLRYVLWRVFARSRKLLVRAPEPAVVEEQDMFVYFVAGMGDGPSASLTRAFLASFDETDTNLQFCADGSNRLVDNGREALSDVVDSVQHRGNGADSLEALARRVPQSALQRCFIMVPPERGVWFGRVESFCRNSGVRPTFVMAVRDVGGAKARPSWLRKIFCVTEEPEAQAAAREDLCNDLSRLGNVQLIDVETGASQIFVPKLTDGAKVTGTSLVAGGKA